MVDILYACLIDYMKNALMFSKKIILRFAALATRMEQYIQGHSRDLVDQAYTKIVSDICLWFSQFYMN